MNQTHTNTLNELSKAAYDNAKAKGFHDKDGDIVSDYARWTVNIHGEVSELWEAARKGTLQHYCDKHNKLVGLFQDSLTCEAEELADIIIRVLDTAGARGINIGRAVLLKMQYNATRPHMHGKLA
jgi:NTP pyrophosphatase (non-canonical NTP hydrolase)